MGLDMYLEGRKYFLNDQDIEEEEGFRLKEKLFDLGYWRKHTNLHNYIMDNFSNGADNNDDIFLTPDDITEIISALHRGDIPASYHLDDPDRDLGIFTRALFWVQVKEHHIYRNVIYRGSW